MPDVTKDTTIIPAPQTANDVAVVAEATFIQKMVEQAGKSEKVADTPAPKPTPKPAKADTPKGSAGDDAEGAEGEDDDEGAGDDEGEDGVLAEGAGDGEAGDEAKDGEDGEDEDEGGEGHEEEAGGEGSAEFAELDPDADPLPTLEAALKKHGAKVVLEALPKGIRPIVRKRLQEMEAPFTRAMKEATEFRPERARLLAEAKFRDDNPVDAVLEMLLKDPTLGERVNERLDEIGESATNREAHAVVVEDKKRKTLEAVTKASAQAEARVTRGQQVEAYVTRQMLRLEIPEGIGVEEAVANHILDRGDITREDIDRILQTKKKQADRLLRDARRGNRRTYIDAKLKDRKTAGLKVRPGQGAAPAPGKAKAITGDEEFVSHMEGELARQGY